jgi:hypothetical protein
MTEMREFGPERLRSPRAEEMWQALHRRWAGILDAIVWLDAPDMFLVQRIRTRDKEHIVKNESADSVIDFLARSRAGYERNLSALAAHRAGLRVLRFDTNQETPSQITAQLLTSFGLSSSCRSSI